METREFVTYGILLLIIFFLMLHVYNIRKDEYVQAPKQSIEKLTDIEVKSIKKVRTKVYTPKYIYFINNLWPTVKDFECGPHKTCCNEAPDDPGGYTCFSVAENYHKMFHNMLREYKGILSYGEKEATASFYIYKWFYEEPKLYLLPRYWRLIVLDFSVNKNPFLAIKYLQKIAGVEQDGKLGPNTLNAVDKLHVSKYKDYNNLRMNFYKTRKHWKSNKNGWTIRVNQLNNIYRGRNVR